MSTDRGLKPAVAGMGPEATQSWAEVLSARVCGACARLNEGDRLRTQKARRWSRLVSKALE